MVLKKKYLLIPVILFTFSVIFTTKAFAHATSNSPATKDTPGVVRITRYTNKQKKLNPKIIKEAHKKKQKTTLLAKIWK